jgi:hypothetical protein
VGHRSSFNSKVTERELFWKNVAKQFAKGCAYKEV